MTRPGQAAGLAVAYRQHRHAQAAADASALAAAQLLPANTVLATQAATSEAGNNFSDGTMNNWNKLPAGCSSDPCYTSTYVSNDTVSVQADTSTPSFFAKVPPLNIAHFNETATATARVGSYSGWSQGLAPWTTDKNDIAWGSSYTFKVDQGNQPSPGNFGNVSLPIAQSGCALGSGSDYKQLIANQEQSCLVHTSDSLSASGSTGNKTGQTQQGLQQRGAVNGFDPYSILSRQSDGSYVLTTYSSPNLVVIPVIDSFGNGGSSTYTVVGSAWFIITNYTNKTVTGMFISSAAPNGAQCQGNGGSQACPIGGYNQFGFKVIELVN